MHEKTICQLRQLIGDCPRAREPTHSFAPPDKPDGRVFHSSRRARDFSKLSATLCERAIISSRTRSTVAVAACE